MEMKAIKAKKCRECKQLFTPSRPLQIACSILCAQAIARKNGTKRRAAQYKQDKEKLKSRKEWLEDCQKVFNRLRRLKDAERYAKDGCISCGSHTGKIAAGHYRSVGAAPELRFESLNVWSQCFKCNVELSSNAVEYRIRLVKLIGDKVDWLESKHDAKHYSIEDIKTMIKEFRIKIKAISHDYLDHISKVE